MHSSILRWPALIGVVAMLHSLIAAPLAAQQREKASSKELIAVMDFGMLGGTKEQGAALSNQLRVEVLKTGKITLVDRSQLDEILKEQALQQSGCTSQECAVEVGKILGIRKIVAGTVTRINDKLWQVSVQLTDVETSETLRAESLNHRGDFEDLLFNGMTNVAKLLFPPSLAEANALVPPPAAPPPQPEVKEESGVSWWWWALGAVAVAGLALAAGSGGGGSKKKSGSGSGSGSGGGGDSGDGGSGGDSSDTGTVGFSY